MITKSQFLKIDQEVRDSLEEAFSYSKSHSISHDYILFLANGEYEEEYKSSHVKLNPYTIDNRIDGYKDQSRINFFIQFMETYYTFPKTFIQTDDNEYRMTIELMIYTHIWESKPFLKELYRLASLVKGDSYKWAVTVPEMAKHSFIRENIRNIFKAKNLKISTIISKGFHSSMRNAFAHSEYHFDNYNKIIHLDTYKGGSWDIKEITYDDWSKRFAYTALLSYHFLNVKYMKRQSLPSEFGKSAYFIAHPFTPNIFRMRKIYYNQQWNSFSFYGN